MHREKKRILLQVALFIATFVTTTLAGSQWSYNRTIFAPDYSWTDYLRFGARFLKPSSKDFCSENVVELMNAAGVEVTKHKPVDTAPWHLLEHALANPADFRIYTVHTGAEFKP